MRPSPLALSPEPGISLKAPRRRLSTRALQKETTATHIDVAQAENFRLGGSMAKASVGPSARSRGEKPAAGCPELLQTEQRERRAQREQRQSLFFCWLRMRAAGLCRSTLHPPSRLLPKARFRFSLFRVSRVRNTAAKSPR